MERVTVFEAFNFFRHFLHGKGDATTAIAANTAVTTAGLTTKKAMAAETMAFRFQAKLARMDCKQNLLAKLA